MLSVDRAGWGNRDPLAGDQAARVADVISVCDALGVATFPILAVSAGGSYALTLAAVELDRVEQVVLAAAAMPYDDEGAIQGLRPDQLALLPILRNGRTPNSSRASGRGARACWRDPRPCSNPHSRA
jgi:pimeloyl-ACP methyl ester carboxylesterase